MKPRYSKPENNEEENNSSSFTPPELFGGVIGDLAKEIVNEIIDILNNA